MLARFADNARAIVRAADLKPFLHGNALNPNAVLSKLTKKGALQRLKSGVYRILPRDAGSAVPVKEELWLIATEIFSPCYIGGWTAAGHWKLIEGRSDKTVVITSVKQRAVEHSFAGLLFRTRQTPGKSVFGIETIWMRNLQIQISDIHRTLVDILVDPSIGGGGVTLMEITKRYAENDEANPELLFQYAMKLENRAVFRRLGFIAEKIFRMPETCLEKVQSKCKDGLILWDPRRPSSGAVFGRWGIRINIDLDHYLNGG